VLKFFNIICYKNVEVGYSTESRSTGVDHMLRSPNHARNQSIVLVGGVKQNLEGGEAILTKLQLNTYQHFTVGGW